MQRYVLPPTTNYVRISFSSLRQFANKIRRVSMTKEIKMPDFPVIDFHIHFPVPRKKPNKSRSNHPVIMNYRQKLQEAFLKKWGFEKPDGKTYSPEKAIELWHKEKEYYGLDKLNALTAGFDNNVMADMIHQYPDTFTGFTHHDIQEPDALAELKRGIEKLGLVGHKMLAPYMERPFNDPDFEPFWRYLHDRELPVVIHFGIAGGPGGLVNYKYISPFSIFEVAREFPNIPFVIPHFGAGYFQDVLHLAWSLPNIYVDSSGSNQWLDWMVCDLDLKDIFKKALKTLGPERMIFGTDSSWFPRGFSYPYLREQWKILQDLGVSPQDQERFFSGNAKRLLENGQLQIKKHS